MKSLVSRRTVLALLVSAVGILGGQDAKAQGFGGKIDMIQILPQGTPAFGQRIQITVRVTRFGAPVKNAKVELWFSGRHGVKSSIWTGKTDNNGFCTTMATIPRNWIFGIKGDPTWVDLNASCVAAPAMNLFRVRGKP